MQLEGIYRNLNHAQVLFKQKNCDIWTSNLDFVETKQTKVYGGLGPLWYRGGQTISLSVGLGTSAGLGIGLSFLGNSLMRPSVIILLYRYVSEVTLGCSFQDDRDKISHPTRCSYSGSLTHSAIKKWSLCFLP